MVEMDPAKLPEESRFLLEMDFDSLYNSSFEKQSYWVRAMKAAQRAGRRAARLRSCRGATGRRYIPKRRATRPTIKTDALERQIREDHNLQPPPSRRHPHPSRLEIDLASNKRLKRPD